MPRPYYPFVIVEGPIGVGKSSLTKDLGAALDKALELDPQKGQKTLVLFEPDEANGNPYLSDFYEDKQRWGFTMQIRLLALRFEMQVQAQLWAQSRRGPAIIDRSFYGDTCFARMLNRSGDIDDRDFETYAQIYTAMTGFAKHPSICIRLMVAPDIAAKRIQKRAEERAGRKCEKVIEQSYLRELDDEISQTTGILRSQGVSVLDMPWDVDRPSPEKREEAVRGLVSYIRAWRPSDPFLDLHKRMVY